jgi:hypothetical protein
MITILNQGSRTNYLLNILTLVDLEILKNKHLKDLIQTLNNFVADSYQTNKLLLSYNPLLTISLAGELLEKIG